MNVATETLAGSAVAAPRPVRERPVLFSAPMVRAILAGTKTQTRRIVDWKLRDPAYNLKFSGLEADFYHSSLERSGWVLRSRGHGGCWNDRTWPLHCPYGTRGDRLWVRETWGYRGSEWNGGRPDELTLSIHYKADDAHRAITLPVPCGERPAGAPKQRCGKDCDNDPGAGHGDELTAYWRSWRPSIHMPRWASRISLEVTGVRVERLQTITNDDARAEGVEARQGDGHRGFVSAVDAFADLWRSINGADSWDANPWVWVIGFRAHAVPFSPSTKQPERP